MWEQLRGCGLTVVWALTCATPMSVLVYFGPQPPSCNRKALSKGQWKGGMCSCEEEGGPVWQWGCDCRDVREV